jgi:hypothetical protein
VKEMQSFVLQVNMESNSDSRRTGKGRKVFKGGIVAERTIRCPHS